MKVEYMAEKCRLQYMHFSKEIEKIINGHRDMEFQSSLCDFVSRIDLSDLTEAEKELIFSKTLCNTIEGRYISDIIKEHLDANVKAMMPFKRTGTRRSFVPKKPLLAVK